MIMTPRTATSHKALLDKLGLTEVNSGTSHGPAGWIPAAGGERIVSTNPATGDPIGSVELTTDAGYEQVVTATAAAFATWRERPAPKRGDLVRDLGNALRELKEPLGDLVTLEMGKIRAEGHGEVQEMIDICDFAVGLSRQLYGLTLASERPGHRMMEQWHPLGPVGRDHRVQLSRRGLVVERRDCRRLRRSRRLEAGGADAAERRRGAAHRQPRDGRSRRRRRVFTLVVGPGSVDRRADAERPRGCR